MAAIRGRARIISDAQFYHVITDTRTPYYVYGAQQDNSTVAIASRSDDGAIGRDNWYTVGGGEAGYIAPNPTDPNIVYAGDYQGNITRFDRRTNQIQSINVSPEISDGRGAAPLDHRFQWTAPIVTSPHDPNTIYYGGERVFKTSDGGMHWEAISGDLTRNDKSKQQPSAVRSPSTTPAPNTTTPCFRLPVAPGERPNLGGHRRRLDSAHSR